MRRVFSRLAPPILLVLVVTTPAMAASGADPGLWAQFLAWIDGRIGVPIGSISFDEWLALMARIHIPIG